MMTVKGCLWEAIPLPLDARMQAGLHRAPDRPGRSMRLLPFALILFAFALAQPIAVDDRFHCEKVVSA
jgi:hypothetical protein